MQILKVEDYIFECWNDTEVWRVQGLFTKEPGTIAWLRRTLRPDDVLYDVGANIGLYTIVAGCLVTDGAVYAFEPHVGTAGHLLRNIRVNRLSGRCTVLAMALHDQEGFWPWQYTSNEPGSSGSQLGDARTEFGQPFEPVSTEIKYATTVDSLLKAGVIRSATVIKIDVDGNEPQILTGMRGLLQTPTLRSVQVETHQATDATILALMTEAGFVLAERHYTASGAKAVTKGADPQTIPHNAVFERD